MLTLPAVATPLRFVKRRSAPPCVAPALVVWTMSLGPTATHGSGGSAPEVVWLTPSNAPKDVAAGAPEDVAWTAAGGVTAATAGARRPRPASAVPRFV